MDKRYYLIHNDIQQGPFSVEELRQMGLTSDTVVWTEGMAQWQPAWQVAELRDIIYGQHQTATPPPYQPSAVPQQPVPQQPYGQSQPGYGQPQQPYPQPAAAYQPQQPESQSGGKGWLWLVPLILLIVLGLAMIATNPTRDKHAMIIKENVRKGISKSLEGENADFLSRGLSMFGQMVAGPIVDEVVDRQIVYHDYIVYSTTTLSLQGKDYTVSYGVLGKVFTASEEQIAGAISKQIDDKKKSASSFVDRIFSGSSTDDTTSDDVLDDGDSEPSADDEPADMEEDEGLGRAIGNIIIDKVGSQIKRGIRENTDSAYVDDVESLVDGVMELLK